MNNFFETTKAECNNKVAELINKANGRIELEMTKAVLTEDLKVVNPSEIKLEGKNIIIVDEDNVERKLSEFMDSAVLDIVDLAEMYVNDYNL